MDKNFHMGYPIADVVANINYISSIPTGKVVDKPVVKVKTISRKKPMFIRRTK